MKKKNMIKVIEEAPDPSVTKRVVCHNCGVKLEYTPSDTRTVIRRDYTGDADSYRAIDCPKCSQTIRLSFA